MADARVRAALVAAGFDERGGSADEPATWVLDARQSRVVSVRTRGAAGSTEYSIDVEEWRGGEGYENEELRTSNPSELLEAIPRWATWAREPWQAPRGWRARLRAYFGLERR